MTPLARFALDPLNHATQCRFDIARSQYTEYFVLLQKGLNHQSSENQPYLNLAYTYLITTKNRPRAMPYNRLLFPKIIANSNPNSERFHPINQEIYTGRVC
jgi:hypothetical protein